MVLSLYTGRREASWGRLTPLESRSLPLRNSENSKYNTNRCLKNLSQIRESRYLRLAYSRLFPESPSIWGISQREKVLETQKDHRDLLHGAADFGPPRPCPRPRGSELQGCMRATSQLRSALTVPTPREGRTALDRRASSSQGCRVPSCGDGRSAGDYPNGHPLACRVPSGGHW